MAEQKAEQKALIVHPAFAHLLAETPMTPRHWDNLPCDILNQISSFVARDGAHGLCVLQRVSRRCRAAASNEDLWRQLCIRHFAVPEACSPPSWQQLYRFNHHFLYKILLSSSGERLSGYRVGAMPRMGAPIFVAG